MGIVLCFAVLQTIWALSWFNYGISYIINKDMVSSAEKIARILSFEEKGYDFLIAPDSSALDRILRDLFPEIQGMIVYDGSGNYIKTAGRIENTEKYRIRFKKIPRLTVQYEDGSVFSIEVFPHLPKNSSNPMISWLRVYVLLSLVLILFIVSIIFVISVRMTHRMTDDILNIAAELEDLATGARDIQFSGGITEEAIRLTTAAEVLQDQLLRNERNQKRRIQELTHDLKGPIAGLHAMIESVELGAAEMSAENIEIMYRELGYLITLIGDMAEVYRLEDAKLAFHPVETEASGIIASVLELYQPLASQKNITLTSSCTVDRLTADPNILGRALGNLVQNALVHGRGETVGINVTSHETSVIFEVVNSGHIPPEDLPHIFKRYWSGKTGGSGLGLSIAGMIARRHGGYLEVTNLDNSRVRSSITIPCS